MSRAVRRQQSASKDGSGAGRMTGLRQAHAQRGARQPSAPRGRFRIGVPRFFEEIFSELKKVTWPTREETLYLTTVVIIVALVVGSMLGGVDAFFNWLLNRLLLE